MKNLSDLYYRLSVEKIDQEFPETEAEREAGAQFAKLLYENLPEKLAFEADSKVRECMAYSNQRSFCFGFACATRLMAEVYRNSDSGPK